MAYVSGGKLYSDIKDFVTTYGAEGWGTYVNGAQEWNYLEFGDRRGSWERFRRVVFCRPTYEDRKILLEFARPDTLIYTNIGMGAAADADSCRF